MLKNNKKRASLTIEIALGLVAAVVVLILILGTTYNGKAFNDKLSIMVNASNFKKLFSISTKTDYTGWDKDPTTNLVATAATQGEMTLADWQAQAFAKIKEYANMPPPLTLAQQRALAKYITLYGVASTASGGPYGATSGTVDGVNIGQLQQDNGIIPNFNYPPFYTTVGNETIYWSSSATSGQDGSFNSVTDPTLKQSAITAINKAVW
jgi:hypothetical protein